MWAWFVVPLGVPPICLLHAVGLSVIVGFLITNTDITTNDNDKVSWGKFIGVLLRPWVCLGFSWIIHYLMTL